MMKKIFKNRVACSVLAFLMAGLMLVSGRHVQAQITYIPIQTSPADLELIDVSTVKEILKSDLIKLENGKIYRLDNIRVPVRISHVLQEYLKQSLLNQKVGIYIAGKNPTARADRFGHVTGHVMTEPGLWIQSDIVSRGLAWVTSSPTSRDLVRALYKYEDVARAQNLGLWDMPEYNVKNDITIENTYNSFQVYEGTLKKVSQKDGFTYMNFGADPLTDFTVVINPKETLPLQLRGRRNTYLPTEFTGHRIRVRGWIENLSGPMINLTHAEQLEFPGEAICPLL